jgi:hypothetical protein
VEAVEVTEVDKVVIKEACQVKVASNSKIKWTQVVSKEDTPNRGNTHLNHNLSNNHWDNNYLCLKVI